MDSYQLVEETHALTTIIIIIANNLFRVRKYWWMGQFFVIRILFADAAIAVRRETGTFKDKNFEDDL